MNEDNNDKLKLPKIYSDLTINKLYKQYKELNINRNKSEQHLQNVSILKSDNSLPSLYLKLNTSYSKNYLLTKKEKTNIPSISSVLQKLTLLNDNTNTISYQTINNDKKECSKNHKPLVSTCFTPRTELRSYCENDSITLPAFPKQKESAYIKLVKKRSKRKREK